MGLVATIGVSCVVWNAKYKNVKGVVQQQVIEYFPSSKTCREQEWTHQEILDYATLHPLIHIEFNGTDHYSALCSSETITMNPQTLSLLMKTGAGPTRCIAFPEVKSTPSGWIRLVNKYRHGFVQHRVILPLRGSQRKSKTDIATHCTQALKSGFNAVFIRHTQQNDKDIFYLKYDVACKAEHCSQAGNYTSMLYLHDDSTLKPTTMPDSSDCFCMTHYHYDEDRDFIDCMSCGRNCHVECAFPNFKDVQRDVVPHVQSYTCPLCTLPKYDSPLTTRNTGLA
jgi:hypothetical protein